MSIINRVIYSNDNYNKAQHAITLVLSATLVTTLQQHLSENQASLVQ